MSARLMVLLAALAGLAVVPFPSSPASAGCVAPWLSFDGDYPASDERVPLVRGEEVTVLGRAFVNGCNDTNDMGSSGVFGCSGNDVREEETPLQDIELVVLQGQPTMDQTPLGTADAGLAADDQLGWVTWTFTVPESLTVGHAVIKTEGSEPLRVRIVG